VAHAQPLSHDSDDFSDRTFGEPAEEKADLQARQAMASRLSRADANSAG
jgi:hypothetical protein